MTVDQRDPPWVLDHVITPQIRVLFFLSGEYTPELDAGQPYILARQHGQPLEEFIGKLIWDDTVPHDLYVEFRRLRGVNFDFFERLSGEVKHLVLCDREGRFLEAFLIFYRLLESMSVPAPFLYIRNQKDFKKSHEFLRAMKKDEESGELKVLKLAIETLIAANPGLDVAYTIDFSGWTPEERRELFRELKECRIIPDALESDQDEITLSYLKTLAFSIDLRNRMFHHQSCRRNIDIIKVGGAENLCRAIVPQLVAWFAALYIELIRSQFNEA